MTNFHIKLHSLWAIFPINQIYSELHSQIPWYLATILIACDFSFLPFTQGLYLFDEKKIKWTIYSRLIRKTKWIGKIIYPAFHQQKILYAKRLSQIMVFHTFPLPILNPFHFQTPPFHLSLITSFTLYPSLFIPTFLSLIPALIEDCWSWRIAVLSFPIGYWFGVKLTRGWSPCEYCDILTTLW